MAYDFSIYPELTSSQKEIISLIGLTLLSLQGAERAIQFCVSMVFSDEKARTWEEIISMRDSDRRKTLGQLMKLLQQRSDIQEDFNQRLNNFVQDRNRFIHGLFCEQEYLLNTEESVARAHAFLMEFQQEIWDIQRIFMGYNILFAKVMGLEEVILDGEPEHTRKHIEQTWANFTKTMDFKAEA